MSKTGFLANIAKTLRGFGIKAPWEYTGPVSSAEYMSHLPKATEYRAVAPVSQPMRAAVPHADPDKVYDIKYFTRDARRVEGPGGKITLAKTKFDPKSPETNVLAASEVPPLPNEPYTWSTKLRPIMDNPNNGYTL